MLLAPMTDLKPNFLLMRVLIPSSHGCLMLLLKWSCSLLARSRCRSERLRFDWPLPVHDVHVRYSCSKLATIADHHLVTDV